jgi:hypothetical protein
MELNKKYFSWDYLYNRNSSTIVKSQSLKKIYLYLNKQITGKVFHNLLADYCDIDLSIG